MVFQVKVSSILKLERKKSNIILELIFQFWLNDVNANIVRPVGDSHVRWW